MRQPGPAVEETLFQEVLRRLTSGICTLTPEQVSRLFLHCELLLRWNRRINLTSLTRLEEVVERHYAESLFLGAHLPAGPLTIVDIGSGAGFPGTPVAIQRPDCGVTLVESHQRKAVFLRESTRDLGRVKVEAKRARDVSGTFDWAISRAVSAADISRDLRKLGHNTALLIGLAHESEWRAIDAFAWEDSVELPWGQRRRLLVGRGVSRGT